MRDLSQLEEALGHHFADKELLVRALTHSSLSHERGSRPACHNEQLEFLGDSILGFIVSRELFKRFPDYSEGQLSKIKAQLVSASHLLSVATRLQLGHFLQLGRGEERSGGREKRALQADAMEAVIAAVYLDAGLRKTQSLIRRLLLRELLKHGIDSFPFTDYKSALQEYLQSSRRPQPRYVVVAEQGPEHRKTFTVQVRVGDEYSARAEGPTKKMAEQEAARSVLAYYREKDQAEAPAQAAEEESAAPAAEESAAPDAEESAAPGVEESAAPDAEESERQGAEESARPAEELPAPEQEPADATDSELN